MNIKFKMKKVISALLSIIMLCSMGGDIYAASGNDKGTEPATGQSTSLPKESGTQASEGHEKKTEGKAEESTEATAVKQAQRLEFEQSKYVIEVYTTARLKLKNMPEDESDITFGVGNSSVASITPDGYIRFKKMGQTAVYAKSKSGEAAVCIAVASLPESYMIEDVPQICQLGYYPSGCEVISATMLLQYFGYDITPEQFIDNFLPMGYYDTLEDGSMEGPDTSSVFIGSPYSGDSLGCYPPVIAYAANQLLSEENEAVVTSGASLDSMIRNHLIEGRPVLIWATMYMWEPFDSYEWTVKDAAEYSTYKDGDTCTWIANEHCLVLTGYDKDYYYFNDPNYDVAGIRYAKEIFKLRFSQIGYESMAITGDFQDGVDVNKIIEDKNKTEDAKEKEPKAPQQSG